MPLTEVFADIPGQFEAIVGPVNAIVDPAKRFYYKHDAQNYTLAFVHCDNFCPLCVHFLCVLCGKTHPHPHTPK